MYIALCPYKALMGLSEKRLVSTKPIESYGGNIWAKNNTEDEGGKGATFAFTIPLIEHKVADDDLGMQINQQQI